MRLAIAGASSFTTAFAGSPTSPTITGPRKSPASGTSTIRSAKQTAAIGRWNATGAVPLGKPQFAPLLPATLCTSRWPGGGAPAAPGGEAPFGAPPGLDGLAIAPGIGFAPGLPAG